MTWTTGKTIGAIALLLVCSFLAGGQVMDAADKDTASEALTQARIEYAQAMVDRAKANLAAIQDVNRRGAGEIAASSLQPFQTDLALAEARLKSLKAGDGSSATNYVNGAKAAVESQTASLQKLESIRAKVPTAVSAAQITQQKADLELAKSRLKVAELLVNASPMDRLEAAVVDLLDDVRELKRQVELLQSRN